jgi:hypothetical protein
MMKIIVVILLFLATPSFAGPEIFFSTNHVAVSGHRYWQVIGTDVSWYSQNHGSSLPYTCVFFEVKLFTSSDGSGTNLSLTGTASASSSASGQPASYANDNNSSTYWSSNIGSETGYSWLGIDLGSDYAVHSMKLDIYINDPGGGADAIAPKTANLRYCTDNTYTSCTTQSSISIANGTVNGVVNQEQTFTGL